METPFVDIHTHRSTVDHGYYSWGIHPWNVGFNHDLGSLETMLKEGRLAAIGETGIDRIRKDHLALQISVFEQHIQLSEQYQKPLIIHSVKATSDILRLHKKHRPRQIWILHGFNGTSEEVRQLTEQGICLSVGENLFFPHRKIISSIGSIPLDCLFLETDTSERTIQEVYEKASSLLNIPMEALKQRIFTNFARLNLTVWKTGKTEPDCSSGTVALINYEKATF